MMRKDEVKSRAHIDSDIQQTKFTPHKCFRYRSEDHLIYKFLKAPKYNKNGEIPNISIKGVIVNPKNNPRMVMIITINGYIHLWHVCLLMMKVIVDIFVTVCNRPIGY